MDETTAIIIGILFVVGIVIIIGQALDRRAEVKGQSPSLKPLTKPWFIVAGLLLTGGLIAILGGVLSSFSIQLIGAFVAFCGACLIWYRRLRSLF